MGVVLDVGRQKKRFGKAVRTDVTATGTKPVTLRAGTRNSPTEPKLRTEIQTMICVLK